MRRLSRVRVRLIGANAGTSRRTKEVGKSWERAQKGVSLPAPSLFSFLVVI